MTHDRVGRDEFDLSQEFLAMMLGVTRQSVAIVAGTLQKAGFIARSLPSWTSEVSVPGGTCFVTF